MSALGNATVQASWFDGRIAVGSPAELLADSGLLHARIEGHEHSWPLAMVRASAPVAGVPLRLHVPDGGVFVLADPTIDPTLFGLAAPQGLVDRMERNPAIVAVALLALIACVAFAFHSGIPWLTSQLALRIPARSEAKLGEAALAGLERIDLAVTELSEDERVELKRRFRRLTEAAQLPDETELAFRHSRRVIGANALALPGGTVIVTDQLVARLESHDQVIAVMAHELGHIAHRHTMRNLLQNSTSALILGTLLGDVSGIGSLAATAPGLLLGLNYSREYENEADGYAIDLLKRTGQSPATLADALEAISSTTCSDAEREAPETAKDCSGRRGYSRPIGYLSTHPDIDERIEHARAAAER